MAVQNSVRSYLGIAKEATKGTAVAPTDFIPVALSSLKPVDVVDYLYDEGLRGSMVKTYNAISGRTRSTFDFGGAVFADTIGWALTGIMGDCATTGSTAPYTHAISLLNSATAGADTQPISYTLTDFYAVDVREYAGIQFHDMSLKFNADGLLEYDAKGTGWLSDTSATPTPSFSAVAPQPVWTGTVSIAGSAKAYTVSGNIDMKRAVTPIYGISNTQDPYQIFVGALETTGKAMFVMENDDELVRYLTNTQPALVFTWASGTSAAAVEIKATLTKGAYTAATIDRGSDFVQVSVDITGLANTTDAGATAGYSPIKWELKNADPADTYI